MANRKKKALLIHVGVDGVWSDGGFYGPVTGMRLFEYVPIPECEMRQKGKNSEKYYPYGYLQSKDRDETYGNSRGTRLGRHLTEHIPERLRGKLKNVPIHHDPNFKCCTYGEGKKHTSRGNVCAQLEKNDLLVFCCSLEDYQTREHGQFIIGYFTVAEKYDFTSSARKKLGRRQRQRLISKYMNKNAHLTEAFARSYDMNLRELEDELMDQNKADFLLITGEKGRSGLLKKAILLTKPCKKKIGKKLTRQSFYMTESLAELLGVKSPLFHMGFKQVPADHVRNLEKLLEKGEGLAR